MAVGRLKKDRVTESGNTAGRPSNAIIGDTYYNGTLEVLEIYNGTQWVAVSAPPSPPTITSVTDVGTGLAYATGGTFTVVAGVGEGGSTPLQYNVSTTAGGFSTSSSSSTISLAGLTPNTSFQVVVNGQNNFGQSINSSPSSAVTATTVPQTPTIGTATASTTANEITVTWTLGNTGGKVLSAITITPYLNGTTAQTSRTAATTSSTSYTFTEGQLTAGSSYTFKVKTTNANGDSLESSATNSATMPDLLIINTLVIAGGGSGGSPMGGGGGAGGLVYSTSAFAPGTSYTVTIGAGAPDTSEYSTAASGSSSNITGGSLSLTQAVGGGGGGRWNNSAPSSGGSGGGGAPNTGGAAGTAGQGNAGGSGGQSGSQFPAGGGGGAGAVGSNGSSGDAADGGVGSSAYSSWGAATSSGENVGGTYYYAGGGGGGYYLDTSGTPPTAGPGGYGGGGYGGRANDNQSIIVVGSAGTANTGGGGGGSGVYPGSSGNRVGKGGGSGIILMRISGSKTASSTTGSPSRVESGGYTYYTFTGSGSITF
jgi:hypothetical protein